MINLAYKTGYFRNCQTRNRVGAVDERLLLGGNGYTYISPGSGGRIRYDMTCPAPCDFEGNPDLFARVSWLQGPAASDPHYSGVARYSGIYEDSGIRSARVLQGKTVTLSWQFRCPNGSPNDVSVQVALVVWRGNCAIPVQYRTDPLRDYSEQLWSDDAKPIHGGPSVQRVDFTFLLPQIVGFVPDAAPGDPESYLGIGFDLIGGPPGGGVLDFGPYQFNVGGPQPIEEGPQ